MDMMYENLQPKPQKKGGFSVWTLVLVIVITFLLAFLVFQNLDRIGNRISGDDTQETISLDIGQSVELSGNIFANGDYLTHTHTLVLPDDNVVGLKSKNIDLNQYSGQVELQGIVEREYESLFIIEVTFISGSLANLTGDLENTMMQEGVYIAAAGIYFPYDFGNSFSLQNNGEGGEIDMLNAATGEPIKLSYFACTTSNESKNCSQMVKNFSASADKTFTNSRGDKFYKLEGVNSWFAANGNYFGYFINDAEEQDVRDLANAMIIVNKDYIEDTLIPKVMLLCDDGAEHLQSVSSHTIGKDLNGLYVQLQGPTNNGTALCKIVLDPSSSLGGQKLSFSVSSESSDSDSSSSTTPSGLDFSVKQFPINLEKALTYTSSSKGYSIVFPSSNIAYSSVGLNEDFDISGLRCSSQMNVIKYSDKDMLETNPTIKVFDCTAKKDIILPSNAFLQVKLSDTRIFIIEIMDGARRDFAENIQISG